MQDTPRDDLRGMFGETWDHLEIAQVEFLLAVRCFIEGVLYLIESRLIERGDETKIDIINLFRRAVEKTFSVQRDYESKYVLKTRIEAFEAIVEVLNSEMESLRESLGPSHEAELRVYESIKKVLKGEISKLRDKAEKPKKERKFKKVAIE